MDAIRTALENLGLEVKNVTDTKLVATSLEKTLVGLDQATADSVDQILEYWATQCWGEFASYEITAPNVVEVEV